MRRCAYPLCGRVPEEGKPLCWPCWARESDFKWRKTPCAHCAKPAQISRPFGKTFKPLCLSCGWRIQRIADRSRALHTPRSLDEIEDSYDWRQA